LDAIDEVSVRVWLEIFRAVGKLAFYCVGEDPTWRRLERVFGDERLDLIQMSAE
jgi:hypothetical protein